MESVPRLLPAVCEAGGRICELGGNPGLFLPITEREQDLQPGVRAAIYGSVMVYFFAGVAIIADMFVASIEEITSRWKKSSKGGEIRTTKVWNETVATLTLMALGSSAPEIFLAVIDVFKKDFHAAELGPSTIVGSASFNLLVIVAVCIVVIPSDEVRKIKELPAFYITAFFSLAAYLWLTFILVLNTKDQVDLWEAVLTFLFLPLLVYVSYKSDVGAFDCVLLKLGVLNPDKADLIPETLHGKRHSSVNFELRTSRESGAASGVAALEDVQKKFALAMFREEVMEVVCSDQEQVVQIPVLVAGLRSGPVVCKYAAARFSAVPGFEYEHVEGVLEFAEGEAEKSIELIVKPWTGCKVESQLLLILQDVEGADFEPDTDGGDQQTILTVTLRSEKEPSGYKKCLQKVVDVDGFWLGVQDWKDQLIGCFFVNGSREEQAEASSGDCALHVLALPWKLLFATVPPPSFFGGWLCFFGSLVWIGVLSSFVSDLAELFGCVLELGDVVTAITFVALGTSMPDLFASLTAAKEDETADASIVNVTGSNSVNVFLGLGLPWTICAVYWTFKERVDDWSDCYPEAALRIDPGKMVFVVESGFIGFSVGAFSCCCVMALLVLSLRRKWLGAELGGPFVPKVVSAAMLLFLWVGWVALVVWRVLRYPYDPSVAEQGIVGASFVGLESAGMLLTTAVLYCNRKPPDGERDAQPSPRRDDSVKSAGSETADVYGRVQAAV